MVQVDVTGTERDFAGVLCDFFNHPYVQQHLGEKSLEIYRDGIRSIRVEMPGDTPYIRYGTPCSGTEFPANRTDAWLRAIEYGIPVPEDVESYIQELEAQITAL